MTLWETDERVVKGERKIIPRIAVSVFGDSTIGFKQYNPDAKKKRPQTAETMGSAGDGFSNQVHDYLIDYVHHARSKVFMGGKMEELREYFPTTNPSLTRCLVTFFRNW